MFNWECNVRRTIWLGLYTKSTSNSGPLDGYYNDILIGSQIYFEKYSFQRNMTILEKPQQNVYVFKIHSIFFWNHPPYAEGNFLNESFKSAQNASKHPDWTTLADDLINKNSAWTLGDWR